MSYINSILDLCGFNAIEQNNLLGALELVECDISSIENSSSASEALIGLDEILQNHFARPSESERQQISDRYNDPILRSQLLPLLSPFVKEINTGNNADYLMLLGAAQKSVTERLDLLVELKNKNYNTQIVYPLAGDRDLWPIHEPLTTKLVSERVASVQNIDLLEATTQVEDKFNEVFAISIDMINNRANFTDKEFTEETNKARKKSMDYFIDIGIKWPNEADMVSELIDSYKNKLENIEFKPVINAPKKLGPSNQLIRPNTTDTFYEMLKIHGEEILGQASKQPNKKITMSIITTQPYGPSQKQQAIVAFKDYPIIIETIAKKAPDDANLSIIFASIAKTIYVSKDLLLEKLISLETCYNIE